MELNANLTQSLWVNETSIFAFKSASAELSFALPKDCFSFDFHRPVQDSFHNVIQKLRDGLPTQSLLACYSSTSAIIELADHKAYFTVQDNDSANHDPWKVVDRIMQIDGYGDHDIILSVYEFLDKNITASVVPSVVWEYMQGTERQRRNIKIAKPKPVKDEFYPWLGNVTKYYDRYLESESSILVLLGPSGTAKTSFIRNMMWYAGLRTMFTYDENLLKSDAMFVDFITGNTELLVVEDADIFLTDREHAGNKLMSKFLNISDGLAAGKHKKKIIFTGNLLDPSRIDHALLRPGRCFDCQIFRRLTHAETLAAAAVAGLTERYEEERDYTLAEIFSIAKNDPIPMVPKKIGFSLK